MLLWFDVEEGYNTTYLLQGGVVQWLWFDVEEGYNTTMTQEDIRKSWLWFDVEEGYNTTAKVIVYGKVSCGLM